ncbi:unnamed protein product [Mytilus edulis]|uniref:Reverse transcriptase domain-containing protein n=1 Tax=Mytilus edulis TaxID=6550 RepID=A0A8S3VHN2_MYTED|nr:unnamed protein product [Mytilus edulis]
MFIQVKYNNSLSGEVKVTQGVRQGAKLSTMLYKRYNNNILKALERSEIGAEIGNIKVMAPTCADDIAVLAENQHEVQALLDIVENCTKRGLVTINPNKSDLVLITKCHCNFSVYLGKDEITQKSETKHLGLIRNSKNKLNTEDRLKLARKILYALLGPGLHARKGMSPIVAYKNMENICHTTSIIWNRNRTANIATYSLLGVEPVEVVVDRLILTFLGNLLHNKETLEFKILERMAKRNGQSYIIKVIQRLEKYGLPEIETLLENESDTLKWKKTVKKHIIHYWDVKWQEEKQQKLEDVRRKHLNTLKCYIENIKKGTYKDLEKDGLLMKLILDSTCESVRTSIHLKKDNYTDIEQITRTFCYGLHVRRTYLLKDET